MIDRTSGPLSLPVVLNNSTHIHSFCVIADSNLITDLFLFFFSSLSSSVGVSALCLLWGAPEVLCTWPSVVQQLACLNSKWMIVGSILTKDETSTVLLLLTDEKSSSSCVVWCLRCPLHVQKKPRCALFIWKNVSGRRNCHVCSRSLAAVCNIRTNKSTLNYANNQWLILAVQPRHHHDLFNFFNTFISCFIFSSRDCAAVSRNIFIKTALNLDLTFTWRWRPKYTREIREPLPTTFLI